MHSNKFKVIVNETNEFDLFHEHSDPLDIVEKSENQFHILLNHKAYHVELTSCDTERRKFVVRIGPNAYGVEIKTELDALIEKMGYGEIGSRLSNLIQAPMPGIILETRAKEGQKVAEGEVLLILEAMKMENAIMCPRSATVKKLHVASGDTVDKNKLLIELE